jgi:hypothetical protein
MKSNDPTAAAFARLKHFTRDENASLLDRMAAETAAGWLALATCYGVTADPWLLAEIADETKNPVARAKTISRYIVDELGKIGIPLAPPFQAVEVLFADGGQDICEGSRQPPPDPFSASVNAGLRP